MSLTINAIKSHCSMPSMVRSARVPAGKASPVGLDIAARSVSDQLLGTLRHEEPDLPAPDPPPHLEPLGPGQDISPDGRPQEVDLKLVRHGHRLQPDHTQDRTIDSHIGQGHQHPTHDVSSRPQPSLVILHADHRIPVAKLFARDPEFIHKRALLLDKLLQRFLGELSLPHLFLCPPPIQDLLPEAPGSHKVSWNTVISGYYKKTPGARARKTRS